MMDGTQDSDVRPSFGSLCTGIGGIDLGLERAGWECRWQLELDDYCQQVLAHHWPTVPKYRDIKHTDWTTLERVDLVAAGYPCQPFSSAGLRGGSDDPRHLWPYVVDALRVLRPRYVLIENVAAHLGLGFDRVLADLASLGFDAEWSIVSACAMGASHARERLFCVAYPKGDHVPDHLPRHKGEGWLRPEYRGSRRPTWGEGWLPEPAVDRVAHGVPSRLVRDPLHALGNAVVPVIAEGIALALRSW